MTTFRQIRIKDIALKCNVSAGTVDRVLHNRGEVSPVTREKILKAFDELKFQPNQIASTLASRKQHIFGTLLPAPRDKESYWSGPVNGVLRRASELRQYGVHFEPFFFDQFSPEDFENKAQQVLDINPEGILFAPFFVRESLQFIPLLKEKEIPFVFIDSDISGQGQLAYVGQNSYRSGFLSGKLMSVMVPADKSLLVVRFGKDSGNQNHPMQREKGFYDWFRLHDPARKIVTVETDASESSFAAGRFAQKLAEYGTSGVFVTNSRAHLAAASFEKLGISDIRLVGYDLLKENVAFLKKGVIDCLICQRPEEQGFNAADILYKALVKGVNVRSHLYTPIDIILNENVDYYEELK